MSRRREPPRDPVTWCGPNARCPSGHQEDTAASFRAVYLARQERRRSGRPWQPPRVWAAEEIICLRETMLAQVHRLTPRTRAEIYRRTLEEFGSCDEKRLDRALDWLVDSGRVIRGADGYLLARRRSA